LNSVLVVGTAMLFSDTFLFYLYVSEWGG